MRQRLWLIDLALLAGVLLAGSTLRDRWTESHSREQALLQKMVPAAAPPAIPAIPTVTPATPASYLEVAQQFVFSKDRNPTVILDPPPPPPAPKPMPPLPLAYGVMDLGTGPRAILAEKAGAEHKSYGPGQKIGQFTLVSVLNNELVFEWDGKQIKRKLEELLDKRPVTQNAPVETTQNAPSNQPQSSSLTPIKAGPGVELSATSKACVPGDTTPAGTVQDGFRKVLTKTPFGESCRWEAAK